MRESIRKVREITRQMRESDRQVRETLGEGPLRETVSDR